MKDFKIYTREELNTLEEWFNTHELPKELQLNKSTFIPNVSETVRRLLIQSKIYVDNSKMQGSIQILQDLKEKLESDSVA